MTGDLEKVTKTLEEISNPIVVSTTKRLPKPIIGLIAFFAVLGVVTILSFFAVMKSSVDDLKVQLTAQKEVTECVANVQVQAQSLFNDLLLSFGSSNDPNSSIVIAERLRVLTEANSQFPARVAACQASAGREAG